MKRILRIFALTAVLLPALTLPARAARLLVPVGQVIGLKLDSPHITVAAYDDLLGSCARSAGLKIGDEILSIENTPIHSAEDIRSLLQQHTGPLSMTVRRGENQRQLQLTPEQTDDGPRLGVYLRQGIAGIGTVTFYDPQTGLFGTLGHGVSDAKGNLLQLTQGQAYEASIQSVNRGRSGQPGQLKGTAGDAFGALHRNTAQGVFGQTRRGFPGQCQPVADYGSIRTGPAAIRCNVTGGTPQEYSVDILKIYPETRPDGRNFLLKVTDPALLEATGGIVQGMSGSPIIQDGQLIGAVTHVLVNDPAMGYGIFIENMLDAAA